jgi:hypothetical protein
MPLSPFCSYACPAFTTAPRASCQARRAVMQQQRWTFYAIEQPVHGAQAGDSAAAAAAAAASSADAGAARGAGPAQLCGEFVNVLMLRDPLQQLRSMVQEIYISYRCAAQLAACPPSSACGRPSCLPACTRHSPSHARK